MGQFEQKAIEYFKEFLENKLEVNRGKNTHLWSQRSSYQEHKISEDLSTFEQGNIFFKIGYTSTQALSINQKQKIYYNDSISKTLKNELRVYSDIN